MVSARLSLEHPIVRVPAAPMFEVAGVVRSSAVDGPGNRYVLFLQGCDFDCIACHNPSTIGRCDGCGVCVEICPHDALTIPTAGRVAFNPSFCDQCGDCRAICPTDSDPAIRFESPAMVVEEIRFVAPFLTGITVTGGEPTRQLPALTELLMLLGSDPELSRLTTLVDTNGALGLDGWASLLPVLGGAMVDLKTGTAALHRQITRHDLAPVHESIRFLHGHGKLTEVRLLVIEGVTDTGEELDAWADFVCSVDPKIPIRLMPFRHVGTRSQAHAWPETTPEAMQRTATTLSSYGLDPFSGW